MAIHLLSPFREDFRETKICRLCGSDNKDNIDIFTSKPISSRSEDLLTKILTVYPLVLYKDDPLPQHICPKCIGNVSTTYQDIQQVMRQQNKWMNLTKAMHPDHPYFHILNLVEKTTNSTKETIKTSYNIEINNIPLGKFLATTPQENQNCSSVKSINKDNINEIVVKNIQNKLESNGFTIKRIKVPPTANTSTELIDLPKNSLETNTDVVTCNYCKQKFSDAKILAQHQLIHLKLSSNRVFQKRLLPKHLRRGRLITLNNSKCIRCLNCWGIHKDNKAILQHWSEGDCEFYCFVCGKEFPHSPKMLREHVIEIHGISYRSIRGEFISLHSHLTKPAPHPETSMKSTDIPTLNTKLNTGVIKKPTYKKPPPKSCTKNEDGTIACKICHKVFDNFRSSNSHMRKHKPPARFREPVSASFVVRDKYNAEDDYASKPSTSNPYHRNATETKSFPMKPPRPAYHVIMKNGPLRGIRTKIVQKRHEFISNYASNLTKHYPVQASMISASNRNDDENLIVPELLTSAVKSENMLRNNDHNNEHDNLEYGQQYASNYVTKAIKSEPLDSSEFAVQEPSFCFICNESFSNARDYELHAMFVHNIN